MNLLFLTKYTSKGASSRYRFFQYFTFFEKDGINCSFSPYFSNIYLDIIYKKKSKIHLSYLLFYYFVRRVRIFFSLNKYDLIIVEKELIPFFPSVFEKLFALLKIKYLLDFDDATFHNYDQNKYRIIRYLLKNKIPNAIKYARGVITGNSYLYNFAKKYNNRVVKIPTSIDIMKYHSNNIFSDKFIIGWIGSKSTSKYVEDILYVLDDFSKKNDNVEIKLIGFCPERINISNKMKLILWNEETEIEELCGIDVGIMPLRDSLWERGKCGLKLIQYMACSKPTISTPLEANVDIDGGNGNLFAENDKDWYNALETVFKNRNKYREIGLHNRNRIKEHYSIQMNYRHFLLFIKQIKNEKNKNIIYF
jgi:glycosyltransferase involved in cell wall biosynthesis